jgi:hypothetical protein
MMSEIQSIRFDKSIYTQKEAREWMKRNKLKLLKGKKVDIAKNFYKYRIRDPDDFEHFITKKIDDGLELIIGFK